MKTFLLKKVATEDGSFCSYKFSGYGNVAEAWKEALEIPDVERKIEELYAELLPFYRLLHGYVRGRMIKSKQHPSIPFEPIFPFEAKNVFSTCFYHSIYSFCYCSFTRHRLKQFYGNEYVSDIEPIPAHLLG